MTSEETFASRALLFCRKGEQQLNKLTIRITAPKLVEKNSVNFRFDEGTAVCSIEFEGISKTNEQVFGVDEIHALSLAVDIDPYIKSMTNEYDFYWVDGAPYFDE